MKNTKPKPQKPVKIKEIKAWAVVWKKDGKYTDQFSMHMAKNLIAFYNSSKDYKVIPVLIKPL